MSTDFRALCAELLVLAEESISYRAQVNEAVRLIDRVRAELVKPEPAEPTDQELLRLYQVATPCYAVEKYKRELDFARSVWRLARWGTPANTINQED